MTMLQALRWSYEQAWRFAWACPIFFLVPAAFELAQHLAEFHAGMYESLAHARAVAGDPLRMIFGHLKAVSIILYGYAVARFIGFDDSAQEATRLDASAVRLFVPVFIWNLLWALVGLDGSPLLRALGVSAKLARASIGAIDTASSLLGLGLCAWSAAAALGNPLIGFVTSLKLTWGHYLWSLALWLLGILPVMTAHYLLTYVAMGKSPGLIAAAVVPDTLVAAFIGVLISTIGYAVALRVTAARLLPLLAENV